jgi:hypothetical protein
MKGWVMVAKPGVTEEALRAWLAEARRFTSALPPK